MRYLLIILTLLLIQCSTEQSNTKSRDTIGTVVESYEDEMDLSTMPAIPPQTKEENPPENLHSEESIEAQIIKRGNLEFEVDSLKTAKANVDQLLESMNGYYENEQFHAYGNRNNYHLNIRIPNDQFDLFINLLEQGTGKLLNKNISAQDVTEEFVDLNIRLESNLAYLNQYKEILKKAKTIAEILEVQEKIRRISSEIESKKGRLKYLSNRVKYSTLNLQLTEKARIKNSGNNFVNRISRAFKNGFDAFLSFLVLLVNLWPFLLLILIIWFSRKRLALIFKRRKNKQ